MTAVVVVGWGVAGTAAALAARESGAEVTIIDGGTGASTLAPGALDLAPWESARRAGVEDVELAARDVLDALDAFAVRPSPALLATTAGIVRPARGADRALLDLASLPPGVVVVPRADHAGWDASALARSWSHARAARERGLEFRAVDAQITRMLDERLLVDADLAARHDDPARVAWLAERLIGAVREGVPVVAVIVPPWLGVERAESAALSLAVGVPCGEALGMPAGPSGLRFERARARALAAREITTHRGRVTQIAHAGTWHLSFESGDSMSADRVVLATGGLIGGGIAYTPSAAILSGALPPHPRATFSSGVVGPLTLGAHGHALGLPGSLFGETPESLAWPFTRDPMLERIGVLASADGRVASSPAGLFAAGDVLADRPRTWLAALTSGARAGRAAAKA